MSRDHQRSRVYGWEDRFVAPRDPTTIAFAAAQGMVDAIWAELGLRYPPAVEKLPRNATATLASATRLTLFLPDRTPSWCLLHELAHALSSTAEGGTDGHGAVFMGLYLQLLTRYLRLDPEAALASLDQARIEVRGGAEAVFLDQDKARQARRC